MKKIIGLVLICLLFVSGCGNLEKKGIASFSLDESLHSMSAELYDFTTALNGKVVQFPMKYQELIKSGWELKSNNKHVTLKSGQYSIYSVVNGELETEVYIANLSKEEVKLSECLVSGISTAITDGVALELPQKIKLGESAKADVISAYGDATKEEADTLIYEQSREVGARFIFKDDRLYEVYLYNIIDPYKKDFSDKVPDAVKNYKDPEELSTDLKDFSFYLYGTTYTMPLPLSRLIEGGWMLAGKATNVVPAGEIYENAVKITRSNRTLTLTLKNTSDYPTILENCFVTSIESTSDVKLDMTLANGCRVGTTKSNLEATFGRDNFTRIEKEGKESRYVYDDPDHGILTVTTNDKTGYITAIKIEIN